MKVLLLGVTGNVGSRMLPALLAHQHQVVAYVRTPAKISADAESRLDAIVVGAATDSAAIKAAILTHKCDAVFNAAGLASMTGWTAQGELPVIFDAVVKAALEAGRERGGAPVRCWLMSGFGALDSLQKPNLMIDYIPIFPIHKQNYLRIKSQPTSALAWSLFCANNLPPKYNSPQFPPPADASAGNLLAKADSPPAWAEKYRALPLIGNYLNIMTQAQGYSTPLEDCVDFIAADLEKGLESEWIGKRLGLKGKGLESESIEKSKVG